MSEPDSRPKAMILDASLPAFIDVPIHPETGEPWKERYDAIVELSLTMARSKPDPSCQFEYHKAKGKRDALIRATTFVRQPHMEQWKPMREPDDLALRGCDIFAMHPDAWAALPDQARANFAVVRSAALSQVHGRN